MESSSPLSQLSSPVMVILMVIVHSMAVLCYFMFPASCLLNYLFVYFEKIMLLLSISSVLG